MLFIVRLYVSQPSHGTDSAGDDMPTLSLGFLHTGKEPIWDKKLTIISTTSIHAEYPFLSSKVY